MVINIHMLRKENGGNPEEVRESEIKRGRDGKVVDEVIDVDKKWRIAIYNMEQAKKELNAVSKEIGERKKNDSNCNCTDLMQKTKDYKNKIILLEKEAVNYEKERDELLNKIGNIVHKSVFVSNDEVNNQCVRSWGVRKIFSNNQGGLELDKNVIKGGLHHHEILSKLKGVDFKKGVEVAGHRGYYLKGIGFLLNNALVQYGLNFLVKKGYIPIQPPYFMKKEIMRQTAELKDFEDTLYRIPKNEKSGELEKSGKEKEKDDRDDLFLIATSEQPISALNRGEWIEEKELPIKYVGVSPCFRKEAGAHGKDTWGLFRVHQFDKVEQFCITKPDGECEKESASYEMQEEMIKICEEFYQSLDLPYRIVSIVSGALNDAASRKYDLEAWFPGYNDYRELVSCSNCTDYQSRSLNIRMRKNKLDSDQNEKTNVPSSLFDKDKKYVHMLNGTLVATQRCMCCILENYQTETGIKIPTVLTPYLGGLNFLPFYN